LLDKSPRPVGLLWLGDPPSAYERLSLSSFVRAGHEVNLYTYEVYSSLPEGVQRRDAREILPEHAVFRNVKHSFSFAMYANWFRYQMIRSTGQIWVDTDMVCLEPLPNSDPLFAWESAAYINNALVYASPASQLMSELLRRVEVLADPSAREVPWGTFGPVLLTDVVVGLGLQHNAMPAESVYPIGVRELWRMLDPRCVEWCRERINGALTLHLWSSKLQKAGIKQLAPPSGSFLEELMLSHDIQVPRERVPIRLVRVMRGHKEGITDWRYSSPLLRAQDAFLRRLRRN